MPRRARGGKERGRANRFSECVSHQIGTTCIRICAAEGTERSRMEIRGRVVVSQQRAKKKDNEEEEEDDEDERGRI